MAGIGIGTVTIIILVIGVVGFFGFTKKGREMLDNITGGGNKYTPQQVEAMVLDYGRQVANTPALQEYHKEEQIVEEQTV